MYIYRTRRKLEQKVLLLLSFFILQVWDCYIHFNLSQYGFNGNRTLQSIKSCHIYLRDLQRFIHNYFQFRWDITFIYYLERKIQSFLYLFYQYITSYTYIKAALGASHIFSCLVTARASDHLQNLDYLWNDTNTKYQFIHSNFTVMNNYYVRQVLGGDNSSKSLGGAKVKQCSLEFLYIGI